MSEHLDSKRPGAIFRPSSNTSKTIESRSKSYSQLSSKHHQKSSRDQDTHALQIVGWGRNHNGEIPRTLPISIMDIACGQKHTVFLSSRFQTFVCGDNKYGQLGLPTSTVPFVSNNPLPILNDRAVSNVFCGPYNTFVLTSKGEVFGMGLNNRGQLGIGNTQDQKAGPVLIESISYKKSSKQLRGRINTQMPMGILTERTPMIDNLMSKQSIRPQARETIHTPEKKCKFFEEDDKKHNQPSDFVKQIACGSFHTLVLTTKGRLFLTGLKFTGSISDFTTQFTQVKLKLTNVQQISCGLMSCGFVTSQGKVFVWGIFDKWAASEPTQLDIKNIIQARLGNTYNLFLTAKGEVYQLNQQHFIRKIQGLPHIRSIACGSEFALAVATESKQVYIWGNNKYDSSLHEKHIDSPIAVKSSEICKISSGSYHWIALVKRSIQQSKIGLATQMSKRERGASQESRQNHLSQQNKLKRSIKVQTDPMLKFQTTLANVNPRTFSTTLQIPFSQLTLEKQISQGGYGIIYKGKWRQTVVAVKIFKVDGAESSIKDFLSQCHAMEALRHPNIVMFLGACTKPPHFAIVLEYCSKGTLWSILQSSIQLSWEDRKRFALDTARGMNYLHSCEVPILHRDLKSLNLLLDESLRVKLADFGWTKGLQNYMTGKIGTYQWMAPQVISGQKYTQKADVFSFGIILWEIASREPPYKNVNGIQVSIEVANNDLRPPIPKKTPQVYLKLMKRCWDRNPQTRPSFRQIIRELQGMKL